MADVNGEPDAKNNVKRSMEVALEIIQKCRGEMFLEAPSSTTSLSGNRKYLSSVCACRICAVMVLVKSIKKKTHKTCNHPQLYLWNPFLMHLCMKHSS